MAIETDIEKIRQVCTLRGVMSLSSVARRAAALVKNARHSDGDLPLMITGIDLKLQAARFLNLATTFPFSRSNRSCAELVIRIAALPPDQDGMP